MVTHKVTNSCGSNSNDPTIRLRKSMKLENQVAVVVGTGEGLKRRGLVLVAAALICCVVHAEEDKWLMQYYKHPEPAKIDGYLDSSRKQNLLSSPNTQAVTIGFMSQAMHDNPDLVTHWLEKSEKFSEADRQVILIAAWYSRVSQAGDYFRKANVNSFGGQAPPDIDALPIKAPADLDFFWARYFASGNPLPIRRIVSALGYEKYSSGLEKYKSSKKTKEDEKAAIYDSIFQAAMWSLQSNCKQDETVYTICKELFFSHELNETEKMWLVLALSKARPDKFAVKIVSGKNPHLEITKSPPPTGVDGAGLAKGINPQWSQAIPDAESKKSEKDFGAQLLLTEAAKFFEDWNKPETPQLNATDRARRMFPLHTVLVFSNPGLDQSKSADVTADIIVRKPDGSIYAEHKNLPCWKGKYVAAPFSLQLAQGRLGIRIEPNDPGGTYSVEVTIRDNIKKVQLKLRKTFVVEDDRA